MQIREASDSFDSFERLFDLSRTCKEEGNASGRGAKGMERRLMFRGNGKRMEGVGEVCLFSIPTIEPLKLSLSLSLARERLSKSQQCLFHFITSKWKCSCCNAQNHLSLAIY